MNFISVRCPRCGASLEVEDSLDTFFCKYCGEKVILDGQNIDVVNAKVKLKEMEYKDKRFNKKFEAVDRLFNPNKYLSEEEKIQKKKKRRKNVIIILVVELLLISALVMLIVGPEIASNKKEKELRNIVEQIQVDISNKDYVSARIKASTLHYTGTYSKEKNWDETREEILKAIDEAEKKYSAENSSNA